MRSLLLLPLVAACGAPTASVPDAAAPPDAAARGYYTPTEPPSALFNQRVVLWLDSSERASVESANGAVTRWLDRSGYHHDATQPDQVARPSVADTGPALVFDGIDDQLLTPGFIEEHGYTIFIAAANHEDVLPPTTRHISTAFSTEGCTAGDPGFTLFTDSSELGNDDLRFPGLATEMPMSFHVRVNRKEGTHSIQSGTSYAPGTSVPKDTFSAVSLQFFAAGNGGPEVSLGAFRDGCQFGHVSIAEVIVFDTGVGTFELDQIENYLARKWGAKP